MDGGKIYSRSNKRGKYEGGIFSHFPRAYRSNTNCRMCWRNKSTPITPTSTTSQTTTVPTIVDTTIVPTMRQPIMEYVPIKFLQGSIPEPEVKILSPCDLIKMNFFWNEAAHVDLYISGPSYNNTENSFGSGIPYSGHLLGEVRKFNGQYSYTWQASEDIIPGKYTFYACDGTNCKSYSISILNSISSVSECPDSYRCLTIC